MMLNGKAKINIVLIFIILFFFASTCTKRQDLVVQDDPFKIEEKEGFSVAIEFLNEEILEEKYGYPEVNPFLSVKRTLFFNRIIVFNLILFNKSGTEYKIDITDIEIHFEGINTNPTTQFLLKEYWKNLAIVMEEHSYNTNEKMYKIEDNVVENIIIIGPEESYKKLVVFMKSFPRMGTAKIYIPVYETGTKLLFHRFEYQFLF